MKQLNLLLVLLAFLCLTFACGGGDSTNEENKEDESNSEVTLTEEEDSEEESIGVMGGFQITDGKVKNYVALMKDLQKENPDFDSDNPLGNWAKAQGYVKKHGFSGIEEFAMVHAKIVGAAMPMIIKEQGIDKKAETQYNEGLEELEKQLADDKIPAEAKEQIRQTIKALKENKETITLDNIEENYAGAVSEKEKQIIKNNLPILKEIFNVKE